MKIGVDIDGVLTDLHRFYLDCGSKYSYENHLNGIVKEDEYDIEDILNLTKEENYKFWHKNLKYYKTKKYAREFAAEVIDKLKKQGNEIHIITARKKDEIKWTKKWLKENRIKFDYITMTDEKLDYCLKNNIDLMIEDNPDNINKISTRIPVICYDNAWNKHCSGENITRCYGWYEIYSKIGEIENETIYN